MTMVCLYRKLRSIDMNSQLRLRMLWHAVVKSVHHALQASTVLIAVAIAQLQQHMTPQIPSYVQIKSELVETITTLGHVSHVQQTLTLSTEDECVLLDMQMLITYDNYVIPLARVDLSRTM